MHYLITLVVLTSSFTDHPRLHTGAMHSRRWLVARLETKPTRIHGHRAKASLALSVGGLWKLSKTLIVEHSDETATVFYPSRSTLQYTTLQRVCNCYVELVVSKNYGEFDSEKREVNNAVTW